MMGKYIDRQEIEFGESKLTADVGKLEAITKYAQIEKHAPHRRLQIVLRTAIPSSNSVSSFILAIRISYHLRPPYNSHRNPTFIYPARNDQPRHTLQPCQQPRCSRHGHYCVISCRGRQCETCGEERQWSIIMIPICHG